jgi:hypothetical protein
MTEVEALLSADKGRVPADTLAFYAQDPDLNERRTYALLAVVAGIAGLACAVGGAQRPLVAVIFIASTALLILSAPTLRIEEEEPSYKRHVLLVTPSGIIVRDAWGLRSWSFDELTEALPWSYEQRPHLLLIERDGTRHAVDYLGFARGERLREVLIERLKPRLG